MLTATVNTWILTESGRVQIEAGEGVPEDALPAEIDRLTAAAVLADVDEQAGDGEREKKPEPRSRKPGASKES